jgi:hypothetical protein
MRLCSYCRRPDSSTGYNLGHALYNLTDGLVRAGSVASQADIRNRDIRFSTQNVRLASETDVHGQGVECPLLNISVTRLARVPMAAFGPDCAKTFADFD